MNWNFVNYNCEERVGFITLNRPEKRNALNAQFVSELKESFTHAEKDTDCKVIVLKAKGDAFCAGADLDYLQKLQSNSYDENLADSTHLMELFKQIYTLPKLVIAQIQGHAIAGGCGLASVCDLAIASTESKFGYSEVKIGFIPSIVSVFLIKQIGVAKSKELLLTGKIVSAEQAQAFGLINKVSTKEKLEITVMDIAQSLVKTTSADSIALTKQLINGVSDKSISEGFKWAAEMNAKARETNDCKKGIAAFLNKEKLSW
ncbi:MAG: methylglutaconyl-CoA hydratase [Flavobacteriales bacterium]|nr:methylglutaconyl-CoA hydratase [Flavobacteriales bacterium]